VTAFCAAFDSVWLLSVFTNAARFAFVRRYFMKEKKGGTRMKTVKVHASTSYEVKIGSGLLAKLGE
jgi:hypothetical protein